MNCLYCFKPVHPDTWHTAFKDQRAHTECHLRRYTVGGETHFVAVTRKEWGALTKQRERMESALDKLIAWSAEDVGQMGDAGRELMRRLRELRGVR